MAIQKTIGQLKVAIIGSGPSGFYVADSIVNSGIPVEITLLEKLPCPYGLIRYGVAPDHQKLKRIASTLDDIAKHPSVTFLGNVELGKDISLEELQLIYQVVVFCNGTPESVSLGIDGEQLAGVHPCNDLIGWYNGHPDYQRQEFDFDHETAVVIGHGNVAIDICRILSKSIDELRISDIPESALEKLSKKTIKHTHIIGRRGPIQSKFTTKELHELGKLSNCNVSVDPRYLQLQSTCQKELDEVTNTIVKKNFKVLQSYGDNFSAINDATKTQISIDFMLNPKRFIGEQQLTSVCFEKTFLEGAPFNQACKSLDELVEITCGLVFTSVGFRGSLQKSLSVIEPKRTLANQDSRLLTADGTVIEGMYVAGWVKRGPKGVIGTNRECAQNTVEHIVKDAPVLLQSDVEGKTALLKILKKKNVRYITFDHWKVIDKKEVENGQVLGKPREKFVTVKDMLACL
jgi:NADPH-dependent glutamate synthase beta subunit-like oxidoreductase